MTPLDKIKHLLHLHACEQEGLASGKPKPEDWFKAVNEASEAVRELSTPSETKPTGKLMNEAQVAEYIKWLDIPYDNDSDLTIEEVRRDSKAKFLSLLSSSSTTGNLIDKDAVLEWLKNSRGKLFVSGHPDYDQGNENGYLSAIESVEDFISSLLLEQVKQEAAKELRCDVCGCRPSVIITTPFGTFCQEHVKYTKA